MERDYQGIVGAMSFSLLSYFYFKGISEQYNQQFALKELCFFIPVGSKDRFWNFFGLRPKEAYRRSKVPKD